MICYPFKSVGRGFNLAGVLGEFAVVIAQSLGDISANHKGAQKSFQFSTFLWPLPNAKWQWTGSQYWAGQPPCLLPSLTF